MGLSAQIPGTDSFFRASESTHRHRKGGFSEPQGVPVTRRAPPLPTKAFGTNDLRLDVSFSKH